MPTSINQRLPTSTSSPVLRVLPLLFPGTALLVVVVAFFYLFFQIDRLAIDQETASLQTLSKTTPCVQRALQASTKVIRNVDVAEARLSCADASVRAARAGILRRQLEFISPNATSASSSVPSP